MNTEQWNEKLKAMAVEQREDIAIVYFNRPKAMNTLTLDMVDEIRAIFAELEQDDSVQGVILTGRGEKAFMAGADVSVFRSVDGLKVREFAAYGHRHICGYIENFPKPVIAAVNGYALGGGCELAMACDIRMASRRAKFGQPEISLGIMPIYGGTKRLQRLVGFGRAKELIMTGRTISAEEALQIGLVTSVSEPEELIADAIAELRLILNNAPLSVYFSKLAVNRGADLSMEDACEIEQDLAAALLFTQDKEEGVNAFLEKRKAEYKRR